MEVDAVDAEAVDAEAANNKNKLINPKPLNLNSVVVWAERFSVLFFNVYCSHRSVIACV